MLPRVLIEQYWDRVRELVEADAHLSRTQAQEAVTRYRRLVEPKVGEMTYHRDAEDVAMTIAYAAG
jgi:hypothetical protein